MHQPSSSAAPPAEARAVLSVHHVVRLLFGFRERVSRRAYLTAGVVLMAVKYGTDATVAALVTGRFFTPWDYINPLVFLRKRALTGGPEAPTPELLLIGLALFSLPFMWIAVTMTMRRAADAGRSPWFGLLILVPGANYLTMLAFASVPSVTRSSWPLPVPPVSPDARLRSALLGVLCGASIAAGMTALSVYVLGSYGASLFFGTPLVIGAASSYIFNHGHPRTLQASIIVALVAIAISGAGLLLFALEGVLCLAMAAPVACGLAVLGAIIGRAIAVGSNAPGAQAAVAVLALPLLAGAETTLDEPLAREVMTVREIDAPPEVVWQNVVTFSELPPPHEWFFEAGIAYPLRARIEGSGVGAVRFCEFSTGPFVEPITVWDEPRRLSFSVTAQPKPMHEWSPYDAVNAPHLQGAMKSERGEFRLTALDGGRRTRLEGSTWYTLHMAPALYWRVWAEWLLHAIHTRVLAHIEELSEQDIVRRAPRSAAAAQEAGDALR